METKMRFALVLLASVVLSITACSPGTTQPAAPSATHSPSQALALQGRVTDAAGILPPDAKKRLADALADIERSTRHQVLVVTTPSLGGSDVSSYTRDLGNRWGIGRKDIDDGVIVLVAPNERKVRIAVGRGLTGILTDAECKSVIDRDMLPQFAKGAFAEGLELGISDIARQLGA